MTETLCIGLIRKLQSDAKSPANLVAKVDQQMKLRHLETFLFFIGCFALIHATAIGNDYSILLSHQLGTVENDGGQSVAVDGLGNVFVAGVTYGNLDGNHLGNFSADIFLAKYDPTGEQLWLRQTGSSIFSNLFYVDDEAYSVATDSLGNAYITGKVGGELDGMGPYYGTDDVFLMKYDPSGFLVWSEQFGTTSDDDAASSIAIDAKGNIFLSGTTEGSFGGPSLGGSDVFVMKLDSLGNQIWSQQIGTYTRDYAGGLSLDDEGNVFISGTTYGDLAGSNAGFTDSFVAKFDGSGDLDWSKQFGMNDIESSSDIATDSAGNVYVTGNSITSSWGYYLSKFDSQGNLLFEKHFGRGAFDSAQTVVVDDDGSVYLSGSTVGTFQNPSIGDDDAFLTKYDSEGNEVWHAQFGSSAFDSAKSVFIGPQNSFYLTGSTRGLLGTDQYGDSDAFLIKYGVSVPEPNCLHIVICCTFIACTTRGPRKGIP